MLRLRVDYESSSGEIATRPLSSLASLDLGNVMRPMNLLRIPILLGIPDVLQQLAGLARRARTEAGGGRRLDAIADNLLLGDLLQIQRRLYRLIVPVDRDLRRVSRGGASGRRSVPVDALPVLNLEGRIRGHLLHLLGASGVAGGEPAGLHVPFQSMPGSGPGELPLNVLLEIVLLLLRDHAIQHDEEDADEDREQPHGDELVPPAAGCLGAPVSEVAGQQAAHEEEGAQDEEHDADVQHPDRGHHLRVQHPLAGVPRRAMRALVMPAVVVQGAGRGPGRRQAAFARLRAITTLASATLLVPALSLTFDGQRRVQSNRVHPDFRGFTLPRRK